MKLIRYSLSGISAIVSILILSGCASTTKGSKQKKIKNNEILVYENNVIFDPALKYTWMMFEDNPTTYYRFKLNNNDNIARLPSPDQMIDLLVKISYQLNSKANHGNIAECQWFKNEYDFLTSSSLTTPEGEILYEVVHWNATAGALYKSSVTGGDLVVVILLNVN